MRQKIGFVVDATGFIQGQSECLDHRGYGLGWLDPQHQSKKVIYKKVGATTILNLPSMSFVRQNERIKGYMTLYIQSITKHYLLTLKQSQKNPGSASAMLTGKFLQIRKVFATSSLLAEEFPDTLQYKISR